MRGWEECLLPPGISLVFYSQSFTSDPLKYPLLIAKFSETLEGLNMYQGRTKNTVKIHEATSENTASEKILAVVCSVRETWSSLAS